MQGVKRNKLRRNFRLAAVGILPGYEIYASVAQHFHARGDGAYAARSLKNQICAQAAAYILNMRQKLLLAYLVQIDYLVSSQLER